MPLAVAVNPAEPAASAAGGRDAFYRGELADAMDAFCRREDVGCYLRKRDFEEHSSTWVEPVSTNYRGYDVWEIMPNTQGIRTADWKTYRVSVDQVETLTGYDFFSNVPTTIQNVIESVVDNQ